jgi:hypothetical protein
MRLMETKYFRMITLVKFRKIAIMNVLGVFTTAAWRNCHYGKFPP